MPHRTREPQDPPSEPNCGATPNDVRAALERPESDRNRWASRLAGIRRRTRLPVRLKQVLRCGALDAAFGDRTALKGAVNLRISDLYVVLLSDDWSDTENAAVAICGETA
jgi:hypothetical protein